MNFLVDDNRWIIRHLVVETSSFLDGRRVLISPATIREVDGATKRILLALTTDTIREDCPRINWDEPATCRHELNYFGQHPYPHFWGSSWMEGTGSTRGVLPEGQWSDAQKGFLDKFGDIHLRHASAVAAPRAAAAPLGQVPE